VKKDEVFFSGFPKCLTGSALEKKKDFDFGVFVPYIVYRKVKKI